MIGQVAQERGHQVATSRPYRYVRHPMYLSLVLNWPALALLLGSLQHQNGAPLGKIYGPQDTHMRGGTIPLNILNPAGKVIDERVVEQAAMEYLISIRTGCFCNPGAGEIAFDLSKAAQGEMFEGGERLSYDEYLAVLDLPSSGALRISLGLVTNFADVFRFVEMVCTFLDHFPESSPLKPRTHC